MPYLQQGETLSIDFEIISKPDYVLQDEIQEIRNSLPSSKWFHHVQLSDGSNFLRWTGLFDFLISADGHKIIGCSLAGNTLEDFQSYLLGQVLSFAMVCQGIEPLHSTVVVMDGQAIAFLGDSGYGKSTLAGGFLQAGYPLLTDDMLVINNINGEYIAQPGPSRIKLFPEIAKTLIVQDFIGTPMNPDTTKLIIPLSQKDVAQSPATLKMIYALQPPDDHIEDVVIHKLSQSQALLAFVQNTFNTRVKGPERLTQQFNWAAELSANLPVRVLSYPRELSWLPKVIDVVLNDIS